MNKVVLMGRLTKDPEIRYTQSSEPLAVARYTLAVNRRVKRKGEAEADFINCVAFGKAAEFAEKYFKKGQMVAVAGRIQTRSWDGQDGKKRYGTDIVLEEQHFAGGKPKDQVAASDPAAEGFYPIDGAIEDDDLPF